MSTSIVMGVMDEIESLNATVARINEENQDVEIILVQSPKTSFEAVKNIFALQTRYHNVKSMVQTGSGVGNAYKEGFEFANSNFVIMMSSDLETNPELVKVLIREICESKADIVVVSRWKNKGQFHGYGRIKLFANWTFQQLTRVLFGTRLTDLTYAFRIYKKSILKSSTFWIETKHGFFLESVLHPLKNGAEIREISGEWSVRPEGQSHLNKWDYLTYLKVLIRIRFQKARNC